MRKWLQSCRFLEEAAARHQSLSERKWFALVSLFPSLTSTQNEMNSTMSRVNLKAAFGHGIQTFQTLPSPKATFPSIFIYCSVEDTARLALGVHSQFSHCIDLVFPGEEPSILRSSLPTNIIQRRHTVTSCHGAEFVWWGPHSPSRHFLFAFLRTLSLFNFSLSIWTAADTAAAPKAETAIMSSKCASEGGRGISDRQSDGTRGSGRGWVFVILYISVCSSKEKLY